MRPFLEVLLHSAQSYQQLCQVLVEHVQSQLYPSKAFMAIYLLVLICYGKSVLTSPCQNICAIRAHESILKGSVDLSPLTVRKETFEKPKISVKGMANSIQT